MKKDESKTIVLHTYANTMEAKIMQDKLKVNGIESFLNDENVLGMDPVGGVELHVFESDKEKARQLIQS